MAQILTASDGAANSGNAQWAGPFSHGVAAAGTATIAADDTSVAVNLGVALNGFPVVVTLNTDDATLAFLLRATWAAGVLTIVGDTSSTGDCTVSYAVFSPLP
jgi:hypothetical protein